MKKNLLSLFLVPVFVLSFVAAGIAADKVGYIDVQRVVSQSKVGQQSRAKLAEFRNAKNAQAEKRKSELESLGRAIQNERSKKNFDRMRFAEMVEEFQGKKKQLERFVQDFNEELVKRDKALVAQIIQKAGSVLKSVAEREGYTVILRDPKAIAYLSSSADITQKVVDGLNKLK